jgi:hypothetical protein
MLEVLMLRSVRAFSSFLLVFIAGHFVSAETLTFNDLTSEQGGVPGVAYLRLAQDSIVRGYSDSCDRPFNTSEVLC